MTGVAWQTTTVRGMLANPRYAGLRDHQGKVVGPASGSRSSARTSTGGSWRRWPRRRTADAAPRSDTCSPGCCAAASAATGCSPAPAATPAATCVCAGPDHGGCGRLTVVADPLERFVADAVLYRLDTPDAGRRARRTVQRRRAHPGTHRSAGPGAGAARRTRPRPTPTGTSRMREWMTAKKPIRPGSSQSSVNGAGHPHRCPGRPGRPRRGPKPSWASLNLSRQHAIVAAVIDHAVIGPGTRGPNRLDPSRVSVEWRH